MGLYFLMLSLVRLRLLLIGFIFTQPVMVHLSAFLKRLEVGSSDKLIVFQETQVPNYAYVTNPDTEGQVSKFHFKIFKTIQGFPFLYISIIRILDVFWNINRLF